MTSKERVYRTIRFEDPDRVPVDIWTLPAAHMRHGQALEELIAGCDLDFCRVPFNDPTGDDKAYETGVHTDVWGCEWHSHQGGMIGEVKGWPLADDNAVKTYKTPVRLLRDAKKEDLYRGAAEQLAKTPDKFALCGWMSLFERMQFLRGTENLYCDIALETDEFFSIRDMVLEYCQEYAELVARIDGVDAICIGDDWGSQRALLINPASWRKLFRPAYQKLVDIAHRHGKQMFFHSDGYILDIYEDMIEMGVAAVNSQVWCMGVDAVAKKVRGRLACWGELSRQDTLPRGTPEDIRLCIGEMKQKLYCHGGLIGQFEVGKDVPLENIRAALYGWNE